MELRKSVNAFFPEAFGHFGSLCHILVILTALQALSLLLYLSWGYVISDLAVLGCHKLCLYKIVNLINKRCVCSECSTIHLFPISLPLFKPPYSLRHNSIEIRPVNNLPVASKCLSERKSCTSLALNQTLKLIKVSEEGMRKAKKDQKLGLLCQTVELSSECKGKVLEGN